MIENEVLEILNSESVDSLTALVDQFREGRDTDELLRLLLSDDDRVVNIGVLIASEIAADHYNTEVFIRRLRELTNHALPSVRFYALGAIFPIDNPTEPGSGATRRNE